MATSYSNPGGQGNRAGLINLFSGLVVNNYLNISYLINGNTGDSLLYFTSGGATGQWIIFDFGPTGYLQVVNEAKFYQSNTTSHGVYQWAGSNDNCATWTSIGGTFTLGGATVQTQTSLSGNTTAYRFYRLIAVSGTNSSSPYIQEFQFKLEAGAPSGYDLTPSYYNTAGQGVRSSLITVTTNANLSGTGSIGVLVDGVPNSNTCYFTAGREVAGYYIMFDFLSGHYKRITEASLVLGSGASYSGTWQWQASNNNATWVNVGSQFTFLAGTTQVFDLSANAMGYRYYRMFAIAGICSNPFLSEINFKISECSTVAPTVSLTGDLRASLAWTLGGAITSATIDNGVGAVPYLPGRGDIDIALAATTTYILTIAGPGGTVTATVTVSVPSPDYPAESDVRAGVDYDSGAMTGTMLSGGGNSCF